MGIHPKQSSEQESGKGALDVGQASSSTGEGANYSTKSTDRPETLSSGSSQHVAGIAAANYDDIEQEGCTTGASPISGDVGYLTGEITNLSLLEGSIVTEDRPITITDEKSKLDGLTLVETGPTTHENEHLQPTEEKDVPTFISFTNVSRYRPADEWFDTGQASRVIDDDGYTSEDIQDRGRRESMWSFSSAQCTNLADSSSSQLVIGLNTPVRERTELMVYSPCVQCMDKYDSSSSQLVVGLNMLVTQLHIYYGYTLEDTQDSEHTELTGYSCCVQCMDVDFDSASSQLVVGLNTLVVQSHIYTLEDTQDREHTELTGYSPCVQCMDVDFDSASSQLVVGLNTLVTQPRKYYDDPVAKPFPDASELLPDVCDTLYMSPDCKPFYAVGP